MICKTYFIFDEKFSLSGFRCIIIDDDPLITDLVLHFSEKYDLIDFCVGCNDAVEGLKLLQNGSFDILFLDYNMPSLSGKDLLDLKRDDSKVIMITSNKEFAVDSYKYDSVYDYLVKPLDYQNFEQAIQRLIRKMESDTVTANASGRSSIMVKDGANWFPIPYNEIIFIKSESNYCVFYTTNKKIMSLAKLKSLEEKLPSQFIRCHRSYIINTSFISRLNFEEVYLDENIIPISAMYRDAIRAYIESGG
jgi:DNA-binding LytR/AlgR family response regulator